MKKQLEQEKAPDYVGHRKRLKEKFLISQGLGMADYELLELVLTIAIPRKDVKPLAKALIDKYKNFAGVISAPIDELIEFDGLKENAAAVLKIVKEASSRMAYRVLESAEEIVINGFDVMVDYLRNVMAYHQVEEFRVLFLNKKYALIAEEVMQRGTIDQVAIHPREVVKAALKHNAKAIILAHNHPSGDLRPSRADIEITKNIAQICKDMEIEMFDHIIIGKATHYSFKTHGVI